MPDPVTATIVVGGALVNSYMQSEASSDAADAQANAARMGITAQQDAQAQMRALLAPYVSAGAPALSGMQALLGLSGPESEQAAIDRIQNSPTFQAMARQGEEAIIQRASATGGLRGGNLQAALAQFRPQMLNQQIAQQYERLAGLTALGQQSAAGVGTAGIQTGTNISNLYGNIGQAQAQGILGQAQAWGQVANLPMNTLMFQYGQGVNNPGFSSIFK